MNAWSDGLALVLMHSLWVGSLAAVAVALLLRRIGVDRPDLRSGVAYAGMVLTLVGAVAVTVAPTVAVLGSAPGSAGGPEPVGKPNPRFDPPAEPGADLGADTAINKRPGEADAALLERATSRPALSQTHEKTTLSWRRLVVGAWLVGVAVMLLGVGRSHAAARGLVRRATGEPSPELVRLLDLVTDKFRLARRVTIRLSDEIRSPLIYGIVSPAVLIPTSLATGAPADTLCAILAHELWHLRRGDLLWGIGQRLLESFFFYHPAVWWMSRQVDREREAACDAAAARVFGRGKPVAAALLDVADWSLGRPVASFAMGRGFLPERVQRLINPGASAAPRVSWGGLLSLVVFGAVALAVFAAGTGMVAREVAVALTPAERVEAIQQAIATNEPDTPGVDPTTGRIGDEAPRYKVSGRFVAPDGEELPRWNNLWIRWEGHSAQSTIGSGFSREVPSGVPFYVVPDIKGYAPTRFGPYKVKGMALDLGDLKLDPGYTSRLRITDPEGVPLEGVRVDRLTTSIRERRGSVTRAFGFSPSSASQRTSDANGVLELSSLTDDEYELTLEKAGYERLTFKTVFIPGAEIHRQLTPSQPARCRFVDTAGQPVSGVEVYLLRSEGSDQQGMDRRSEFLGRLARGEDAPEYVDAISDAEGRVELTTLRANATYYYLGLHTDYAPTRIDELRVGELRDSIVLAPPLEIRGRIVGDFEAVTEEGRAGRQAWFGNPLKCVDMSWGGERYIDVDEEGAFVIRQLVPGRMTIRLGSNTFRKRVTESIDDLVIDLEELAREVGQGLRTVRLRLQPPGDTPLEGAVLVGWELPETPDAGGRFKNETLKVRSGDPTVELQAPIGARMWFRSRDLVGAYAEPQELKALPAGEGAYEWSIPLKPAGQVVGRVVDQRGKPLPACTVSVRPLGGFAEQEDENLTEEGRFSLGPVPLDAEQEYVCDVHVTGTWRHLTSAPFKLTEAKPIRELTLTMPDPVYVTGRVLDHLGEPAAEWQIGAEINRGNQSQSTGIDPLDADGRFRIAVTPDRSANHQFTVWGRNGSAGITIKYQPGMMGVGKDYGDIRLGRGAVVRGVVVDEQGRPAVDTHVMLAPAVADNLWSFEGAAFQRVRHTRTDEAGRFELSGIERVRQRIEVGNARQKVTQADPQVGQTKDKYGNPYMAIEPGAEPLELRFVVRGVE